MTYDLRDVFYLDGSVSTDQSDGTVGIAGDSFSGQLDVSTFVDSIARGKKDGYGLAIYRVQFGLAGSSSGSDPVAMAEAGIFRAGLVAGAGTGNVSAGTTLAVNSSNAPSAKNALTVSAFDYYGPSSGDSHAQEPFRQFITPTKEVPYIVVRDNVCLIGVIKATMIAELFIQFRMECASIKLDKSTLNQLLRTQTV
jgi:hypothetical protein